MGTMMPWIEKSRARFEHEQVSRTRYFATVLFFLFRFQLSIFQR
jgi:hypothetical protein